ncbi:uncharacterized protein LOC126893645 [Daktulosphaira vitifoliae]|uniref:uncharacterized protein LOC126893645 n=1 Tax=Daktulosphaira vitifoliae TaxID=58002 RepID=UPI0021A9BC6B|nr:uncharacterized protein LOC126893645 [Daktulosphaira vitifoliae]
MLTNKIIIWTRSMKKGNVIIVNLITITFYCVANVSEAREDLFYWKCKLKLSYTCPNPDVNFYLYTSGRIKRRFQVDMRSKRSLLYSGWNPNKKNVILIHGFNGAENENQIALIRNAYLKLGDHNVFTVDWMPLTKYPCYIGSLRNVRLVSQCAAQFYSHLTYSGASAFDIHCVGHSLGAHICGMMSNHLTLKQYKIIGLDPARPLIAMLASDEYRLTRDDAKFVQVIHTNAGLYGDTPQNGDVDFCVNGGRFQPMCSNEPNIIRRARCSHLASTCYYAASLFNRGRNFLGIPCTQFCTRLSLPDLPTKLLLVPMGLFTPEGYGAEILFASIGLMQNVADINYWRCVMKRSNQCPDLDIKFFLYHSDGKRKKLIDPRSKNSLRYSGWDPNKKNVLIIHGFNGTESKTPMTIIRDAFLRRKDHNVFLIDWEPLTFFPCYLSSLSNTRLVAQCSAQFYAHLTYSGASAYDIQCVGHSLGAHICGMMSNHLTHKQHKIIGLDPARPLVDRYGTNEFRLTRDDANMVQVIHTNAGFLGEVPQVGHVDFCVNGGRLQPSCINEPRNIRNKYCSPFTQNDHLADLRCRARCSHFLGACFFAATVSEKGKRHMGVPCTTSCQPFPKGVIKNSLVSMGFHTPESARGTFCIQMRNTKSCPFD